MIPDEIRYFELLKATLFYKEMGYVRIEAPWVVSREVMEITQPKNVALANQDQFMVASGEQSFLQLMLKNVLAPGNKFQCVTPCYRPQDADNRDGLHFSQFIKLELIEILGKGQEINSRLEAMMDVVRGYLGDMVTRKVSTTDEPRLNCETLVSWDIEVKTSEGWVEFGSYGLRRSEKVGTWLYGTGLPLPRYTWMRWKQ